MENPASAKQLTPKTTTDLFVIDDLLDFPTDDMVPAVDAPFPAENLTDSYSYSNSYSNSNSNSNSNSISNSNSNSNSNSISNSNSNSNSAVVDCCSNSSLSHSGAADNSVPARRSFTDAHFSTDISVPVPYDDLAELEWLSNVVEESFSCEDLQKLQLISGIKARPSNNQPEEVEEAANNTIYKTDMSVPGKARTKRSRAAPCDWTSRLLVVSPTASGPTMSSESDSDIGSSSIGKKALKSPTKKKEVYNNNRASSGDGRKCLHCSTDKTPQWRSGPMGPKTLCNACGVRYKSGRLVPEYRPAASPTFVLAKHSNSHRKVLELRRQKEMQKMQQQQQQQQQYIRHQHHQNMMFDVPNNDDYLIHQQHITHDYRQLI